MDFKFVTSLGGHVFIMEGIMLQQKVILKICPDCGHRSSRMWCMMCFPSGFPKPFKYRTFKPRLKPLRGLE